VKPKDLRWADEAVRILTAHSVKGLEFSHVFVGAIDAFDEAKHQSASEELRLLYVAMTRATLWLALSARRSTPLVERVRDQVQRLGAEWARLD
jgi:superfamily I DNA/RNA helicase